MDTAYISALSALAGSVIGGFTSFATSWLVQQNQTRTTKRSQELLKRENMYGAFIDEVAQRYAEAMEKEQGSISDMVRLYSDVSRMKLFAPEDVLKEAQKVLQLLQEAYLAPTKTLSQLRGSEQIDPLRNFSEVCRRDLGSF